jgi:hypothetical protein
MHRHRSSQLGNFAMSEFTKAEFATSESASLFDAGRYERACDEAIAMCDGNMRSTIKALIMANEYLEAELQDLQTTASIGSPRMETSPAKDNVA